MENLNKEPEQEVSIMAEFNALSPKDKLMIRVGIVIGIIMPIALNIWSFIYYAPK